VGEERNADAAAGHPLGGNPAFWEIPMMLRQEIVGLFS
jgi:hypothetical protein